MHLVCAESTLLKIDEQTMLSQFFQYSLHRLDVLRTCVLHVDEYIIKINNTKDIQLFSQRLIDVRLERCRGIREPEWQYLIFEVIITSPERSLSFITLLDAKPMICSSEIQLSVSFGHGQSINEFPNKRKRVPVFDRDHIQSSIVYAESQAPAGFPNRQDR